ncbi:unnamed protein product [Eretmochelys imbricata]
MTPLTIATLNTRGCRMALCRSQVLSFLREGGYSVIFVQETHRSSHSRLDRIYLSRFHLSRAHSSSIWLAPFCDHHLATVTASLRRGRPIGILTTACWRMRAS